MKLSAHESDKRHIFNNFLNFFATTCGMENIEGCTYTLPDADFPLFNSILNTEHTKDKMPIVIKKMKQIYQHKKQFCWWLTDFVKPQELAYVLADEGFQRGSPFTGMIYDLSRPITQPDYITDIQIQTVTCQDQFDEWIKPLQVSFEIDDRSSAFCANALKTLLNDIRFKHFYVESNGQIVGVASLFIENGISGFYNLGVLPEYRHQKIATALKCFRLKISQDLGAKGAILQSSEMGKDLDQRLGFKPVFDFVPYFSPLTT